METEEEEEVVRKTTKFISFYSSRDFLKTKSKLSFLYYYYSLDFLFCLGLIFPKFIKKQQVKKNYLVDN